MLNHFTGREGYISFNRTYKAYIRLYKSSSACLGITVIRPQIFILGKSLIFSTKTNNSSGFIPLLFSSPPTFTSIKIGITLLILAQRRLISCASSILSTECIKSTLSTIYFTLFVCKAPIKCQLSPSIGLYLPINSCTLFSPATFKPASTASSISIILRVFVAPTRTTSSQILFFSISCFTTAILPLISSISAFPTIIAYKPTYDNKLKIFYNIPSCANLKTSSCASEKLLIITVGLPFSSKLS